MTQTSVDIGVILKYFKENKFEPLLKKLTDQKVHQTDNVIISVMYCFIKEQFFTDALLYFKIQMEKQGYFLTEENFSTFFSFKKLPRIDDQLEFLKGNIFCATGLFYDEFQNIETKILTSNYEELDFYYLRGSSLIFALSESIMALDLNKKIEKWIFYNDLLGKAFVAHIPSTRHLHYLTKHGISATVINSQMKQQKKDLCYFLVCKELLKREEFDTVKDILLSDQLLAIDSTEEEILIDCCNILLKYLDDWDIYEFALSRNIRLEKSATLNFLFYDFFWQVEFEMTDGSYGQKISLDEKYHKLINRITDIEKLEMIHEKFKESSRKHFDLLLKKQAKETDGKILDSEKCLEDFNLAQSYTEIVSNASNNNEYSVERLLELHHNGDIVKLLAHYYQRLSEISLKLLLSALIATKEPENIILALFLIENYLKDNSDSDYAANYEFIKLFIFRYFLFTEGVMTQIKKLQIREIQTTNLSYLITDLTDLYNNTNVYTSLNNRTNKLFRTIYKINLSVLEFIKQGKLDMAHSMLRLKEQHALICKDHILKIDKIIKNLSQTPLNDPKLPVDQENQMFQNLFGKKCQWFFSRDLKTTAYRCKYIDKIPKKGESTLSLTLDISSDATIERERHIEIDTLLNGKYSNLTADMPLRKIISTMFKFQEKASIKSQ
ncbi:hypothetical protein M153_6180004933 [Pseudoloma neurophilia]|uniref:Uncharacterized protein n=1 Tax=Pseudoloma neurophilia TaxID=146866 RepID=A0A0R0LWK9_9MICR|nr:hypothetical protein M153_6180004933 [Pseudoloma neurophilia]